MAPAMTCASLSLGSCCAAVAPGAARQVAVEPVTSLDSLGMAPQSRLRAQWVAPRTRPERAFSRQVAMQDSMADMDADDISALLASDASQSLPQSDYPPGMVRYESMVVLRPDVTDEERLAFTQRYEEFLVAGGAMFVEMFNRGMQPLAYNIKTKNMGGVLSRYLDGIYLLFMYVTKPESQKSLQAKLNSDDDVIRSTTFRLKL